MTIPISDIFLCAQTKNLLTDLNQTIAYGLPILEAYRAKVESISVNLRDALNQSRDRSVLPTDLETATTFVDVVAKLVARVTCTRIPLGCPYSHV